LTFIFGGQRPPLQCGKCRLNGSYIISASVASGVDRRTL